MSYRKEAIKCVCGDVLKLHKQLYAKYNGDFDRIYTEEFNNKSYSGKVIVPGSVYELCYLECTCQKIRSGLITNPERCECSRQSILYILSQLDPENDFEVHMIDTILKGGNRCTFRIIRKFKDNNIRTQFNLIAKKYDEDRRCFIPCFDDYYIRSVSLLKNMISEANNIVDLGAGTGLLSKELFQLFPKANFTLIDISEAMLNVAKERFHGLSQFQYITADYTQNLPKGTDIFCSALSVHHLENEAKQLLYSTIYEALPEGGALINLDQFCSDSSVINDSWNVWWMNYIDNSGITKEAKEKWLERKKLDREVSVQTSLKMLQKVGFKHADCVYQFMKFGTLIAVK